MQCILYMCYKEKHTYLNSLAYRISRHSVPFNGQVEKYQLSLLIQLYASTEIQELPLKLLTY
jgi:hypothetical protein